MLNKIRKNLKLIMVVVVCVIVVCMLRKQIMEGFSKLPRYMYMYNGIPRNSSYDTRGEPISIKNDPSKTGVYYNSPLDDNETNQRVKFN
jgi:hypothetical protein